MWWLAIIVALPSRALSPDSFSLLLTVDVRAIICLLHCHGILVMANENRLTRGTKTSASRVSVVLGISYIAYYNTDSFRLFVTYTTNDDIVSMIYFQLYARLLT